jgi:hypothetical protein
MHRHRLQTRNVCSRSLVLGMIVPRYVLVTEIPGVADMARLELHVG